MCVQPRPGPLAARRIWRIQEHRGLPAPPAQQYRQRLEPVPLQEHDPVGGFPDRFQPLDQRLRVPPREQAAPVLPPAAEGRSRGEDTAAPGAIEHQGAEPVLRDRRGRDVLQLAEPLDGRLEPPDPVLQRRIPLQRGAPERGDVAIDLHHEGGRDQVLHDGGQGDDRPPGERLDQDLRLGPPQPLADMRYEPRLAPWVAQGTPLRYRGDVDDGDARDRESRGRRAHSGAAPPDRLLRRAGSSTQRAWTPALFGGRLYP